MKKLLKYTATALAVTTMFHPVGMGIALLVGIGYMGYLLATN